MSNWPDGWSRGDQRRGGAGEPTAVLRGNPHEDVRERLRPRTVPSRPPMYSSRTVHPGRFRRRFMTVLVVLLILIVGGYAYFDSKLHRVDALPDTEGRPAETPGQDWLLVGSDSREGLTSQQKREFATGDAAGRRTDTMMLLHIPSGGGKPTLVSLPRDSYVPIPGQGRNKLNAAFAFGGPKLLTRTVETVTGIRIDHYLEVGFGGFVQAVDAVGGVRVCLDEPLEDPKAGIDLKAGCQTLKGGDALGYVRTRNFAMGDLDRVENQRKFLGALLDKATGPGVLLNPFRSIPLAQSGVDATAVDRGDHLHDLLWFAFAMRNVSGGKGVRTTVPVAGTETVPVAGSVVLWDRESALTMFNALQEDRPVPRSVLPD
ncbi:MAG: LCP family protein [Carbonactinosporaceae bacterium]